MYLVAFVFESTIDMLHCFLRLFVCSCPTPAPVSLITNDETWEVTMGENQLPFTCQTPAECYYGVGLEFSGYFFVLVVILVFVCGVNARMVVNLNDERLRF